MSRWMFLTLFTLAQLSTPVRAEEPDGGPPVLQGSWSARAFPLKVEILQDLDRTMRRDPRFDRIEMTLSAPHRKDWTWATQLTGVVDRDGVLHLEGEGRAHVTQVPGGEEARIRTVAFGLHRGGVLRLNVHTYADTSIGDLPRAAWPRFVSLEPVRTARGGVR